MSPALQSAPCTITDSEKQRAAKLAAELEKKAQEKAAHDAKLAERNATWRDHCIAVGHYLDSLKQARGFVEGARLETAELRRVLSALIRTGPVGEAQRVAAEIGRLEAAVPILENVIADELEGEAAPIIAAAKKFAVAENIDRALWPVELR